MSGYFSRSLYELDIFFGVKPERNHLLHELLLIRIAARSFLVVCSCMNFHVFPFMQIVWMGGGLESLEPSESPVFGQEIAA